MPRVRAWEQLNTPEYCGKLDMAGLYDLLLLAGYGEDTAQEIANRRGEARLSAGLDM